MYCSVCGKEILDEAQGCTCGTTVQPPVTQEVGTAQPSVAEKVDATEVGHGETTLVVLGEQESEAVKAKEGLAQVHVLALPMAIWLGLMRAKPKTMLVSHGIVALYFLWALLFVSEAKLFAILFGAAIVWLLAELFRPDICKGMFGARDTGALYLPQDKTLAASLSLIQEGFHHPEINAVTRRENGLLFIGSRATFQLTVTEGGIDLQMIDCKSKKAKKQFCMMYSKTR